MAFNIPKQQDAGADNVRDVNKPDAYINISLPRADGTNGKVDSRGLRLFFSRPGEEDLANFLQTEEGIKWFRANAVITCNIVTGVEKAGFAIGQ